MFLANWSRLQAVQALEKQLTVVHGSNKLVIEVEHSIHDALCVIHCLVKERALIAGGGIPELELALC